MAKKPIKPSKKNLVCKIVNIEPDPKRPERMIVAIQINDGTGEPWIKGFSILPDKSMSIDDLMDAMIKQDLSRPVDPYSELKKFKESGKEFVINLTAIIEPPEQS